MSAADATANAGAALLARLDRLPVWPWPRRVTVVVGAGFFFSFFDIVTIAFALPVVTKAFAVSAERASWAITSGLVGYIFGALLDSRIGDRFGRRIALLLSVSAFSLGSVASATSTSLEQLILWRFVSGMGIGAEIALVTAYMAELAPAPVRGRASGQAIAAGFLGLAAVPIVALALIPNFAWGWRALFVIGGLGGVVIGFMRRTLPASPRWLIHQGQIEDARAAVEAAEAFARDRTAKELPGSRRGPRAPRGGLRELLRPPFLGRLVLLALVWFTYYVGNYAWLTLAPELLGKAGLKLEQSFFSLSVTGLGFVLGAVAAIHVSDRIERRTLSSLIAMAWAATLVVIGYSPTETTVALVGFVASFTIGMLIPILYTYTGENFPTRVRATAIALTDGVGHLGGAFCGQIVFAIYDRFGFSGAFVGMAATGALAAVLLLLGIRVTGKRLDG